MRNLILSLLFSAAAHPTMAQDDASHAKLGPNAVPITTDSTYLRANPAPDYWAFAPFIKPQFTSSACSIASVTGALNGLQGLPDGSEDQVMSQPDLLTLTANAEWAKLSAEGGDGVTFDQLSTFTQAALTARMMDGYKVATFHPTAADATSASQMRALLTTNEANANDALLVYFNQGVVTGDWDGPHISVIGAYDATADRVLILEVDQDWYIPYWTPASVLLDAMIKPTSAEHGVLQGQTGGFVHITKG